MIVEVCDGRYLASVEYGNDEQGNLKIEVWAVTEVGEDGHRRELSAEAVAVVAVEFGEEIYDKATDSLMEMDLAYRLYASEPGSLH